MKRQPAIFFGHGSPIIAMLENDVTAAWRDIYNAFEAPRAILCISAHWLTRGIGLTAQIAPPTIHDFGGFPRAMHEFEYPAPGSADLVRRVAELLAPRSVTPTADWGLDHGSWTVLMKIIPSADIPVVQMSIDASLSAREHFELGRLLSPLRDEGVLIAGTGNIVHNLRDVIRRDDAPARGYAERFGSWVREAIADGNVEALIDFESHADCRAALPTSEHYLPLLYVAGASTPEDRAGFVCDFVQYSSIDMTTAVFDPT